MRVDTVGERHLGSRPLEHGDQGNLQTLGVKVYTCSTVTHHGHNMNNAQSCHFVCFSHESETKQQISLREKLINLVGVILRDVIEVELEQEVMLLQSTEHAG